MKTENLRNLINLFEARHPELEYSDPSEGEVIAHLKSYNSQVYTKLAQKVERISALEEEIKQLKEEVKQETRDNITDLFDASDAARTRVVDTLSFIMTLSKDPTATVAPKYKDILEELTKHLTPELIVVLEGLKKSMVTVTQKAPALRIRQKELDEGIAATIGAKLKNLIGNWGINYDAKLTNLKQMAFGNATR